MSVSVIPSDTSLITRDFSGGGIQVSTGVLQLNLSTFKSQSSPNTWGRDDVLWTVNINTVSWKNKVVGALIVFPLTFDVDASAPTNQLGWGIDSWGLDLGSYPQGIGDPYSKTTSAAFVASLVLKTKSCEVLRIGYQLTLLA